MMIIVYKSNTGYTEQYAKLLGDALDMPSYSLDNVPRSSDSGARSGLPRQDGHTAVHRCFLSPGRL